MYRNEESRLNYFFLLKNALHFILESLEKIELNFSELLIKSKTNTTMTYLSKKNLNNKLAAI